ncbi:MAG TPA: bifunctional UDP-sugar hydrolase/5'-nucleotidase [Polyangiaceae bacterium]|nr:bifunctional UDP-sugar hydrolase/5'-nucleotidase [Polyangiaceae bacterium]
MLSAAACGESKPEGASGGGAPAATLSASAGGGRATITLLVTADENGALLPTTEEGKSKGGGAAELMGLWVRNEKHCPGPVKAGGTPSCPDGATIALSAGDHFGGAPISNLFAGESTAQAMKQLGYSASALGNHDFDFGRDAFKKYAADANLPYVAANVTADAEAKALGFKPFVVVERKGAKVAVVGLASVDSEKTTMPNRFNGVAVGPYEDALAKAVPEAWAAGADAVVVLAHECPDKLAPVFEKHADWKVSLVAGAHCAKPVSARAGGATLSSAGRRFEEYLRAQLEIDPSKPAKERVVRVEASRVPVAPGTPPDAATAAIVAGWKTKLDTALGEKVGFSSGGLAKDSPQLSKLVGTALREFLKADVAVINKSALRDALPKGEITEKSVYAALPYDNSVMIARVKGSDLLPNLANPKAVVTGATEKAKGSWVDAQGKPIDPAKTYSVAMPDFLYFGGDDFTFEKADPNATETGMVWQTVVIEWLKEAKTSAEKPLEQRLK